MTQAQKLFVLVLGVVVLGWLTGFRPVKQSSSSPSAATTQVVELADTAVENDYPPLFQHQQLSIQDDKQLLTFLETVDSSPESLGRLENQLKTFFALFDLSTLFQFVLATSEDDASSVKQTVQDVISQHAHLQIPADLFRYLVYSECSDQLSSSSKAFTAASTFTKHQLARLACANQIQTPFYVNIETEVFFTRSSNALSFFKESDCSSYSAVCNSDKTRSYQAANDIYPISERGAEQQALLLGSAAVLRLQVAIDWRPAIGVMPQVFSTDVAKQLGAYIEDKFEVKSWQAFLLDHTHPDKMVQRRSLAQTLFTGPAWDAYNVYWLFATRACVFENFHVPGSVLQAAAVWSAEMFHQWSPCESTFHQPAKQGVVSLVHPSTNIPSEDVWSKIQPCLRTLT